MLRARFSRLHLRFWLRALRGGRSAFKTGWRQDGLPLVRMPTLLHFHFGEEHGGSHGGDGNAATFRAADTVEDVLLVAGGHDAGKRGKRSSNNIHAADQLIGTAVGVDAINDHGQNLKGLGKLASGEGEAALNVVEVEAVGLALALHFVDELLAKLR